MRRRVISVNLIQLKALVAVQDHRTFTAAACALRTVQSNVSGHVARLEGELGVVLVDRQTNELTAEGGVVAQRARRVLAECNGIVTDVKASLPPKGTSHIGMIATTARWLAPSLLNALITRQPDIHLVVTEGTSSSLAEQLAGARLDAAILHATVPSSVPLLLNPLFDEELFLVVPPDQWRSDAHTMDLQSLSELKLLLPPPGTAYRPDIDRAAAAQGIQLQAMGEFDGVRLIASLTFDGYGPSILPATAIPRWLRDRCRIVPVIGLPTRRVAVAQLPGARPSRASRAVVDLAAELVACGGHHNSGIWPCVDQPLPSPGAADDLAQQYDAPKPPARRRMPSRSAPRLRG